MVAVPFCFVLLGLLVSLIPEAQGLCRNLRFSGAPIHGYRLNNYVIRTISVSNEDFCQMQCLQEPNCVSYNFKKNGENKCDLNSATYEQNNEHSGDLARNEKYVYREAENACATKPCQNNATCQAGFTDRDYQCLCIPGFTGDDCENDRDYRCLCVPEFTGHDCENEKLQVLAICEGKNGKITCENGEKISILDANYGRLDRDTCLHSAMSNINCRSSNSLQIVKDTCDGETECELFAVSPVFGGDPCGGTYKYLQVKYRCQEL